MCFFEVVNGGFMCFVEVCVFRASKTPGDITIICWLCQRSSVQGVHAVNVFDFCWRHCRRQTDGAKYWPEGRQQQNDVHVPTI